VRYKNVKKGQEMLQKAVIPLILSAFVAGDNMDNQIVRRLRRKGLLEIQSNAQSPHTIVQSLWDMDGLNEPQDNTNYVHEEVIRQDRKFSAKIDKLERESDQASQTTSIFWDSGFERLLLEEGLSFSMSMSMSFGYS
jgi:hypothetical protein